MRLVIICLVTLVLQLTQVWAGPNSSGDLDTAGLNNMQIGSFQKALDFCGWTDWSRVIDSQVVISTDISSQTITADTASAKEFLAIISGHGAGICNSNSLADAPFRICFKKGSQDLHASEIYCDKTWSCPAPYTGCGESGPVAN